MAESNCLHRSLVIPVTLRDGEVYRINSGFTNPYSGTVYKNSLLRPKDKIGVLPCQIACLDRDRGGFRVCTEEDDIALGIFILDSKNDFHAIRLTDDNPRLTLVIGGILEIDLYETHSYLDSDTPLIYSVGDELYCSPFGLMTNEVNSTSSMRPLGIVISPPSGREPRMVIKVHDFATNPAYVNSQLLTIGQNSVGYLEVDGNYQLHLNIGSTSGSVASGLHSHTLDQVNGLINGVSGKIESVLLPDAAFGVSVYNVSSFAEIASLTPIVSGDIACVADPQNTGSKDIYVFNGSVWENLLEKRDIKIQDFQDISLRDLSPTYIPNLGDLSRILNDPNPDNNGTFVFDGSGWVQISSFGKTNVYVFSSENDRDSTLTSPSPGDIAVIENVATPQYNKSFIFDGIGNRWAVLGDSSLWESISNKPEGLVILNGSNAGKIPIVGSNGLSFEYFNSYISNAINYFSQDVNNGFYTLSLCTEADYQVTQVSMKLTAGSCGISLLYNNLGLDLQDHTVDNVIFYENLSVLNDYVEITFPEVDMEDPQAIVIPTRSTVGLRVFDSVGASRLAVTVIYRKRLG